MARTLQGLRAQYYGDPMPEGGLRQYHRSEQQIAGVIGTETYHPPHFIIPRHSHYLTSFYVVLEGGLTEFYGSNQRELEACSVVFTPPGEIHSNAFHGTWTCCFLVEFTSHWADRLAAPGISFDRSMHTRSMELTRLALGLYREFRNADRVSPLSVEGLALEILAALARQSESAPESFLPGWLRKARGLLNDRFSETLTLGGIAALVGIHPARLVRAFRKRHGCSLAEYQRRLRIKHASQQLVATRRPLAEIAVSTGFADQAHFCRVFKAYTGLTPARFRATFAPN